MAQPSGAATNTALKPSNARQSKRLFVHNIPASATEESIINFFNLQLNGLNVIEGSDPCISAQLSKDREFALLEFKQSTDATVALALDGISMEENDAMETSNGTANGSSNGLSIRRPKDYIVPSFADDTPMEEGGVSSSVPDTQNKVSVTNIPPYLSDEQVMELLVAFGELKAFVLVKDRSTDESRGIAFCEYTDPAYTDIAVEGLNDMDIGDRKLRVKRASIGNQQASGLEMSVNAMSMLAGTTSQDLDEGRVLQLLNMVTAEELIDQDDYDEICEDVKEECQRYGPVLDMKVPRPTGASRQAAGVGKIFVRFDTPESAGKALRALAGRKFADRTVVTTFFSEVSPVCFLGAVKSMLVANAVAGKLRGQCMVGEMELGICYLVPKDLPGRVYMPHSPCQHQFRASTATSTWAVSVALQVLLCNSRTRHHFTQMQASGL